MDEFKEGGALGEFVFVLGESLEAKCHVMRTLTEDKDTGRDV